MRSIWTPTWRASKGEWRAAKGIFAKPVANGLAEGGNTGTIFRFANRNNNSVAELSNMRLTEILKQQNIKVPLTAKTKADAIAELVNLLAQNGDIPDSKKVLDAVLDREATRTTGIGNGLAIPHGKCPGTDQLVIAVGKAGTPIDFQAIDGRPVTLIWLLSSPPDKTGPHIHALARISRLMTVDKFRQALNQAGSAQQIYDIIVQQENSM
jgi:fructose-specific phosphotransferase system IIA component